MKNMKNDKGFTLIEVMIAVVILSIVAAIAVPNFMGFMTDTRRVDAITSLTEIAGEQQRFMSEQNRYATSMTEMGYAADPMISEEGLYMITVNNPTPTSYVLTATPVAGGAQANDAECGAFTLNSSGVKGADGGIDCW
jgi:type IV pilus assembly protein PilE